MINLSLAVERRDDILLEKLNEESDRQDDFKTKIDEKAEDIMKNFSNGSDYQIITEINKLLGGNVNFDIYSQFITDICYSQAEFKFKKLDQEINDDKYKLRNY